MDAVCRVAVKSMVGVSNRVSRPKVLNFMRLLLDGDTFKASGLVDRIAFLTMDFVHGYHCLGPPGQGEIVHRFWFLVTHSKVRIKR
jgi:hypothetical protein